MGAHMQGSRPSVVLDSLILLALALAATPASADKCTGAKLMAIARKEAGLLICDAKVVATGDSNLLGPCLQKVVAKYVTAFAKAGSCSGDPAVCECLAEYCAMAVRGGLPEAGPSKCEAARLKTAAKKAAGKLKCNAKAAATGVPVDGVCIHKAEAKYDAAFAKTTSCGGDPNAVEMTVDQQCVSAVGADPTGGRTVGARCASWTSKTSTPPLSGGTTTTTVPLTCGNGILDPGEECDGGPLCSPTCRQGLESCCQDEGNCRHAPAFSLYGFLADYCGPPNYSAYAGDVCGDDG